MQIEKLLNKAELAEFLGVSIATIDKRMRRNSIPFLKFGRCVRFDQTDIRRWLRECERPNIKEGV